MTGLAGRARRLAFGLVLVLTAVAVWGLLRAPQTRPPLPEASAPGAALAPPPDRVAALAGTTARDAELDDPVIARARGPRPHSLRGTDVDGGLSVAADGRFVPDPDALALFDYFLAASGEEPESVIRQRLVDQIHARLTGEAALAALALLDDYLAYRAELRELAQAGDAPGDLERRLQWIRELRRRRFGDETAEALFGQEEQVTLVDLERRRVATDPALEPEQRTRRLAALDAQLPESVRQARERARAPQQAHQEVEALRQAGASEDEIFAARERRFGWEAAERLAALDAQRAEWDERVAVYQADRDRLLASEDFTGASAEARSAELDSLRREHFDAGEAQRVEAMERFGR